jgi:hypothetical protein
VARADGRLLFTEREGIERASKFSKHDLDDHEIFVALFINGENFGYDGSHFAAISVFDEDKTKIKRGDPSNKAPTKDSIAPGALGCSWSRERNNPSLSLGWQVPTL